MSEWEFSAVVTDIREESRAAGRQRWHLSLDRTEFRAEADAGVLVAVARNGARLEIAVIGVVEDAGETWHVVEKPLGVGDSGPWARGLSGNAEIGGAWVYTLSHPCSGDSVMRFLRKLIVMGMIVGAGTVMGLGQSQHVARIDNSPKNTALDNVAWLDSFIGKNAGFSLSRSMTVAGAPGMTSTEKPVQGKLVYRFNTTDVCHISWQAVASGDEELKMLYPGIDEDEDLATIVDDSIYLQPFDVESFEGAGTNESNEYVEGGGIVTAIQPGAPQYWKLTAHYVYGFHGPDEPFGFIFSDEDAGLHAAEVLDQAVHLCRGPRSHEIHEGDGCDSTVTAKIEVRVPNIPSAHPTYINHGDVAVSCVVTEYAHYFKGTKLFRTASAAFDIDPGGNWSGNFGIFGSPLPGSSTKISCYPKGSVDIQRNSCSDLYHPVRWNNAKTPKEPATPPQTPAKGLQKR